MRRVGEVIRTVGGLLVARAPDDSRPEIGEPVIDESLAAVGRVVDVMGPVSRPYVVIAPDDDRPTAPLLGRPLYVR